MRLTKNTRKLLLLCPIGYNLQALDEPCNQLEHGLPCSWFIYSVICTIYYCAVWYDLPITSSLPPTEELLLGTSSRETRWVRFVGIAENQKELFLRVSEREFCRWDHGREEIIVASDYITRPQTSTINTRTEHTKYVPYFAHRGAKRLANR